MDDNLPAVGAPLARQVRPLAELVERLRGDAYALPSCGPWIERNGSTLPNNSCSQAADEIEQLCGVLETLAAQSSGVVGSAQRSDCMAALAAAALRA